MSKTEFLHFRNCKPVDENKLAVSAAVVEYLKQTHQLKHQALSRVAASFKTISYLSVDDVIAYDNSDHAIILFGLSDFSNSNLRKKLAEKYNDVWSKKSTWGIVAKP